MKTTENFGLQKPDAEDFVDIDVINENMDIIDEKCARESWYGTCPTSYSTSTKIVTTTAKDFKLKAGSRILVKFTYYNSASTPYLNVDGTGEKSIKAYDTTAPSTYSWYNGEVVEFLFDGSYFIMIDGYQATTSGYGVTKLSSSVTSTATNMAATPSAVKVAYDKAQTAINDAGEAYALAEDVQAFAEAVDEKWQRNNIVTIETSQNWTVPDGVYEVSIFIVDGGYDGADGQKVTTSTSSSKTIAGGDGGNGGACGYLSAYKVTAGQVIPVIVGGANGGKSSFNGLKNANISESTGGSGMVSASGASADNFGNLPNVNNVFNGCFCPLNGKMYGVSGSVGGVGAGYTGSGSAGYFKNLMPGGIAGKDNADKKPAPALRTGADKVTDYGLYCGGGGASYDDNGTDGTNTATDNTDPGTGVGGNGGNAVSFGCGGGGGGSVPSRTGYTAGQGGTGAQGAVIIAY